MSSSPRPLRDCTSVPRADGDAAASAGEPDRNASGSEAGAVQAGAGSASPLPARPGVGRCRYTRLPRLVKVRCVTCRFDVRP